MPLLVFCAPLLYTDARKALRTRPLAFAKPTARPAVAVLVLETNNAE